MRSLYGMRTTSVPRPRALSLRGLFVALLSTVPGCDAIYALPSTETDPPSYCTMFHHMVKSGGTSIRNQLVMASETEGLDPPGLCVIGGNSREDCLDALHHSSVVMGYVELLREPMEEVARDCEYFTVMRHPIDRLVSAFYYCPTNLDVQIRPSKWCGGVKDAEPITSRLLEFANSDWRCKAMYQLSFSEYCPPGAFCEQTITANVPTSLDDASDWGTLARAEEALLGYTAVGIFEEWELTMRLFQATVRSPVRNWSSDEIVNPGPVSTQRGALLRWAHSSPAIRQAVAGDLLLYDLALSIFKRQTSESLGMEWSPRGSSSIA